MYLRRIRISVVHRRHCASREHLIRRVSLRELVFQLADLQVLLLELELVLGPQIAILLIQLVHVLDHFSLSLLELHFLQFKLMILLFELFEFAFLMQAFVVQVADLLLLSHRDNSNCSMMTCISAVSIQINDVLWSNDSRQLLGLLCAHPSRLQILTGVLVEFERHRAT